jgi:hypothetical protein
VVLATSAFRCAKTSAAFAPFEAPSVAVVTLLVLLFLEVSTGSSPRGRQQFPTFPTGSIFFPDVGGVGRGKYKKFMSSNM